MDFFDDDFDLNPNTEGTENAFSDDFSDDFFNDDDFGSDTAVVLPAKRSRFNKAGVRPEPINLSNSFSAQQQSPLQFCSPELEQSAYAAPVNEETPVSEETPVYEEAPINEEPTAYQEALAYQEAPAYQETPVPGKTPAEYIEEYSDCHYKFIPCGTDVNELNKKYIYSLRFGTEWGYSTVIVPVTSELCNSLCLDSEGRQIPAEQLREARKAAIAQAGNLPGAEIFDEDYGLKTSIMAKKGISIDVFENARHNGIAINCFSSFVRNGVTTKDVIIVQIPVTEPWNVFAWFPVGEKNGMPTNEKLIIASRHWNELCGAVPAVLDCGVVEYFVPNGKPSYDAALQIAHEQFAICHERVLCLTRSHTLGELVDSLTKSCVWYLGWK